MKSLIIVFTCLILFSCSKEYESELLNKNEKIVQSTFEREIGVLTCTGGCIDQPDNTCGLTGIIRPGEDPIVECTCSDCVMTWSSNGKEIDPLNFNKSNAKSTLDDMQLEKALTYLNANYNWTYIESIQWEKDADNNAITYLFMTQENVLESIMVIKYNFRPGGVIIDCSGGCDCRERYIHTSPPEFECTCADCEMTITNL